MPVENSRYLVKNLLEQYGKDENITSFVDNTEIWIVPLVNPDGHEYSRTNPDWRKNKRDNDGDGVFDPAKDGVDLNRNWGHKWGEDVDGYSEWGNWLERRLNRDTSHRPGDPIYAGPSAFSEPETQAIKKLLENSAHQFRMYLDLHSYGELVLYPPGHTKSPGPDQAILEQLAKQVANEIGYEAYQSGVNPYLTTGDSTDYIYEKYKIPSFCLEIGDEVDEFYPPSEKILPTNEALLRALLIYINEVTNPSPYIEDLITNPGGDTPDDFVGIIGEEEAQALSQSQMPKIAVIGNGFWYSFVTLADKLGNSTKYLSIDFNPEEAENYKLLVIPSGGLYGIEGSKSFKNKIEEYVRKGGTLFLFSQQHGYEYEILPGNIKAYGWTEDQSCHSRSVYIDTYHQILSGQDSATCDVRVDGFFTDWPDDATILLRRTKNSMPAMVMYPYGDGLVIASTIFTDWAYAHNQSTTDGINLVRDIILWGEESKELPEYSPNETITLMFNATNDSDYSANTVKFIVYNPNRKNLYENIVSMSIGSKETVNYEFNYTPTSTLGIWSVNYILYSDSDGKIQLERPGQRFIVSNPPSGTTTKTVTFGVNSDSEYYAYGSEGIFTINIWNHGDTDKSITCWYSFPHNYWRTHNNIYGAPGTTRPGNRSNLKQTLDVPAGGSNSFTVIVPIYSYDRLWAEFYDESNQYLGRASRGFYSFTPSVNISATTDKTLYHAGEDVSLTLTIKNKKSELYTTSVKVIVLDPENVKVYEENRDIVLPSNGTVTEAMPFTLPGTSPGGAYIVRVEAYQSGQKIGSDSCYFTVPEAYLAITPHLPGIFDIGTNPLSFDLELFGLSGDQSGTFEVTLKDPTDTPTWTDTQDFTIPEGEAISLNFDLPIDEILFGNYILTYQATYGAKIQTGSKTITSSPVIEIALDKGSYRVRDTLGMGIKITNSGKFQLDNVPLEVNIPDTGYAHTDTITLAPGQSTDLSLSTILPAALSPGTHNGTVSLILGNTLEKGFGFQIPSSKLVLGLEGTAYNAGDTFGITIGNTGGVDTQAEYNIVLTDSRGVVIQDISGRTGIKAGAQRMVYVTIPSKAANEMYQCTIHAKDLSTTTITELTKALDITGLSASLDVATTEKVYRSDDTPEALADIEMIQGSIEAGTLNLKAIRLVDQEKTWTTVEDFETGESHMVWILEPGYVVPDDPLYPDIPYTYENPDPVIDPQAEYTEEEEEPPLPEHPYVPDEPEEPEGHNTLNTYGDYLRIGIDSYGHLGDRSNNWGFGFDRSGSGTNFYETVAKGWWGDGYVVGYDSSSAYTYESDGTYNMSLISETITEDDNTAQVVDITQSGNLNINQTFTLDKRDKYLRLDVILTNTGGTTLTNVSYARVTDWDIITGSDGYDYLMDSDNLPIIMAWNTPGGSPMYCGLAASSNTPNTSFDCDSWDDYRSAYALDNYDSNGRRFDGNAGLGWWVGDLAPGASYNFTIFFIAAESKEELIDTYNRIDTQYWISLTYDAGRGVEWTRLLWTSEEPEGTDIRLRTRTAETEAGLDSAAWSGLYDTPGSMIASQPGRFIQVKAILEAEDPKGNPPLLHDITVQYITKDQVWEENLPVSVATSAHLSTFIDPLEGTGRFLLEGALYSGLSQLITTDTTYFYIDDGDIHLTFEPDRKVYKPGQTVTISGQVTHEGSIAEEGLDLAFTADGSTLYSETFDLAPGETHPFTFTTTAFDHTFFIYGSLKDMTLTEQIEVEEPALTVNIDSPDVVGRAPFDFTVTLKNPTRVDADITMTIAGDAQAMTIPGGETRVVSKTFSTTTDLTITVNITGDVTDSHTKTITFGEAVQIIFDPQAIYPQGTVDIPYTVENIGLLDTLFDLETTLDGDTTTRTIFVAQGETLSDVLYYDLVAGSYTLTYSSFFDSGSEDFRVARYNDLAMDLDISYHSTPSVLILKDGGTEGDLSAVLTEAGMEVTVSPVYEYQWDRTNPDPLDFDVVIMVDAIYPSYTNNMPSSGQTALVDFVNNGGGLIMTEWLTYEQQNYNHYSTMAELMLFEPSQWYYDGGSETLTVVKDHPVTEGLPSSFAIPNHSGNRGGVKAGIEVLITGSMLNDTVAVKEHGLGRIVQYAIAGNYIGRPFTDNNMKQLLINSVNWASGRSADGAHEASVTVSVENRGYNDFIGQLNTQADFLAELTELALAAEEKKKFKYTLDLNLIEPGTYTIVASALSNGNIIQEVTGELTVAGPLFELTAKPENPVYVPGEEVTMAFTVQNSGQAEGETELHLTVLDLLDDTRIAWIAPGEEAEVTFTFLIPDDLPEKEYKAILEFNGETIEIPFKVQGIKIAVSASLDKTLYDIGDIALLTLDITNEGVLEPDMYAWGKSDGNEDYQEFTLTDHQVIELNLPIDETTQDRIFYGIYLISGRAVHLNSIYIRVRRDILTLYTDKGVYNQGETVTVFVQTTETGTLSVDAPGFEGDIDIAGDTTFSFTLPEEMVSGSYSIDYQLGDHSGLYFFDVIGYSARILECQLDKGTYDPIDEMTVTLLIEANQDIPTAFIRGWIYDPHNNYNDFFDISQPLTQGENLVKITQAFSTPYANMHRLIYGIYKNSDELLLTSGAESFDVTEAAITSLVTDKDTYEQTDTAVAGIEGFACEDFIGELQILLDGTVISAEDISWSGYHYQEYSLDLEALGAGLGDHLLEAQIVSEETVVSRKEKGFTVIDSIPPEIPTGLAYTVEGTTIILAWDDNTEPDLAGYNLFRDGVKVNVHPIASSTYRDEGLAANHTYVYNVSAVDVNKNESDRSPDLSAVLDNTPPIVTFSPASDVVSATPVTVTYTVTDNLDTSPTVSANYATPTTFDHAGAYTVTVMAQDDAGNSSSKSLSVTIDTTPPTISGIYAITTDTGVTIMWETDKPCDSLITYGLTTPPSLVVYDSTLATSHAMTINGLPPNVYGYQVTSTDAVGNEVTEDNSGAYYWFDIVGLLAGWPQGLEDIITSSPLAADLDNDGSLEVVIGSYDGQVYAWHADGTPVSGWPQATDASIESSPAAADLDGDEILEVVIGADNGQVYAWHADGTPVSGWPQTTADMVKASPTLIDLDEEEGLEVIVGSYDGSVYAWHADGTPVSGWPQATADSIHSSSAVADIDLDGALEVVVGSQDGSVYAWHADGTPVSGWPQATGDMVNSSPALADLDGDEYIEVIVGCDNGSVYAWHADGTPVSGWPQATPTSVFTSPSVGDLDNDGNLEIVAGNGDGTLYAWHADGTLVSGWPQAAGTILFSSAAIGDTDGDGFPEIVIGSDDGWVYTYRSNGALISMWPTGHIIFSSPAIADLDADGDVEVVIGAGNNVYVWDCYGILDETTLEWTMFRHDTQHTGYYGFTGEKEEEVLGDLDEDKDVDMADYMVFRSTLGRCYGQAGYLSQADYDGDACITYSDYRVWYGYYLDYLGG